MKEKISTILPIQKQILEWTKEIHPQPIAIYGFGSFFSQGTHSESDIDIALLFQTPIPNLERWKYQETLARRLGKNVDLVDLRKASLVIQSQILSTGQLLYCQDETSCHQFETYVYSAYARFNEERKEILENILNQGSIYGR